MVQDWISRALSHPGATIEEIQDEPDWEAGHSHRVGFKNRQNRRPGFVSSGPDDENEIVDEQLIREAREKFELVRGKAREGKFVNFRDIVKGLQDFHLIHPARRSVGWRYVLECTEDGIKYGQDWPANVRRQGQEDKKKSDQTESRQPDGEEGMATKVGRSDRDEQQDGGEQQTEDDQKDDALARQLVEEQKHIASLRSNDGLGKSPQSALRSDITIDQADQFTPDNWFPRSPDLVRLTGASPLNAEPPVPKLVEAGLITPNSIHYVRNHGVVPRLVWEFHEVEVTHCDKKLVISMEELETRFSSINIPVLMACDGNRRKELNMIKMSKGFGWGPGAASCAYWKGPLLRDVLLAAGVPDILRSNGGASKRCEQSTKRWINFEGADELAEGNYSTSIPLEYAMDPTNDVMLAYSMNDHPLPPDHGYPVRVVIPGYVGGRSVKWLRRLWTSEEENSSHYHIWDNRVLPSFVTNNTGKVAEIMFHHPNTACNEQTLNSIIAKPAHGEEIPLPFEASQKYRVQGFAYNGGGNIIDRVELSLDEGRSWIYCSRKFPDAALRHGKKYWTWLHWHVDVPAANLLSTKSITVRCFDANTNTQPEKPNWNLMGMMNNAWYKVRAEVSTARKSEDQLVLLFKHPVQPGTGTTGPSGWMQPSMERQIESAKNSAGLGDAQNQRQFTREEIERHDREDDCWIVVDGRVYDATSVLSWHPGGKIPIMAHAGQVHRDTTDEFDTIHDAYARDRLNECLLGTITQKAAKIMNESTGHDDQKTGQQADGGRDQDHVALRQGRWSNVKLVGRKAVSEDTSVYTFELPENKKVLGLDNGQHLELGFHLRDKMLIRPYTPTRPILPPRQPKPTKGPVPDPDKDVHDGVGTFDLTVKTYFPNENQPGGAMSNILDTIPIGEEVDMKGPQGEISYHGNGRFVIEGQKRAFRRVSFVLGGSGVTPGYSIVARIMLAEEDPTEVRILDGNKSEQDILMRREFDEFERNSDDRLKVTHVLSEPDEDWKGLKGFVTKDMLGEYLFPPAEDTAVFLCGPPVMIKKAVLPGLKDLGYIEDKNIFGF